MSLINSSNNINNQNNLNQGQETVQNENENHLIGNILAEDNSDSDIDEGGGNMNTKLGGTSGGLGSGLGSGSGTSGNQNTPSFGNGAKLGGFGGAGGFGSIGANAPYGGAFINSGIPERVGSTPASDLSLKYYGQHDSPMGKKSFGLGGQGTSTNLTGTTFSNLFAQPTDQYDGETTLIRRPSDAGIFGSSNIGLGSGGTLATSGGVNAQTEIKQMPMHPFLSSIQQNVAVNNGQVNSQIQDSANPQLQQINQQRAFEVGAQGQTSNIINNTGISPDTQNLNQKDIYRTKEYYDYYHNLNPKDPRMPQPIYIPDGNDQTKKTGQGSSQAQGNNSTITTEDIEKKLSQLKLLDDGNQIQNQNNQIYQKLQGLQAGQDLQTLQQIQAQSLQYQQFLAAAQQQAINQQQTLFASGANNFVQQSNPQGINQTFQNQTSNQGSGTISQSTQQNNAQTQNNNNGGGNGKSKKKGGRGGNNAAEASAQAPKSGLKQPPPPPPPPQPQPPTNSIISIQGSANAPVNNLNTTAIANNIGISLPNANAGGAGLARMAGFQGLPNQSNIGNINQAQPYNSMIVQGLSQQQDQPKIPQNNFGIGYTQPWGMSGSSIQNPNASLFSNQQNTQISPLNFIQSLNQSQNTNQIAGAQGMLNQIGSYNQQTQNFQQQSLFGNAQTSFGSNPHQAMLNPMQQFYSQLQSSGLGGPTGVNQNISQLDPVMMSQYIQMQQFMKNMILSNSTMNQSNSNPLLNQGLAGQLSMPNIQGGNLLMNNPLAQPMAGTIPNNFSSFNPNGVGSISNNLNSGNSQAHNPLSQLIANQQQQTHLNNQQASYNNFQQAQDNNSIGNGQQTNSQRKNASGSNASQSSITQNTGNTNVASRGGANQRGGRGGTQAANQFNTQNQTGVRGNGAKNENNRGGNQSNHPMEFHQSSNGANSYANYSGSNQGPIGRGQQNQQSSYDVINNEISMSSVVQVAKSEFLEDLRSKIQNGKKIEIRDIKDHVVECSMDQYGSRFIQQKYDVTTEEEKELIFSEILPEANSLMNDVFGNYVVQKLFEYGNQIQTATLADQLLGNVLKLTKSMYGCRVVQKALEFISLDQQKLLVQELKDAVLDCIYDQNGNHVIQKCIEKMPNDAIDFIVESVSERSKDVIELCLHTYGCRVIQRILENCSESQTRPIIDFILADIAILTKDQFGNYVIQHILEHGKYVEDKNRIVKSIKGKVIELSNHKFASNVVEKCLQHGSAKDKVDIIDEFLESNYDLGEEITNLSGGAQLNGALYTMMKDRYGNYVIQKCIEVSQGKQREILMKKITACTNVLRKQANYSRHVYNFIENYPEGNAGTNQESLNKETQQKVGEGSGRQQQNTQNSSQGNNEGTRNAGKYRPRGGGTGPSLKERKNAGSNNQQNQAQMRNKNE